jgi:hypothetical protein
MKVMNSNRFLIGKPAREKPLWRQRCRWNNIIKVDIKKVGCGGME